MNRKTTFSIAAAALAVVGTIAVASTALAHGRGGPGGFGGPGMDGAGFGGPGGHGFGLGRDDGDRGELLAKELGISVADLQAARLRAMEKGLAEAVKAGKLTQERADLMLAGAKLANAIDHDAVLAEALGISVADLKAARAAGTSLRDLLTQQKLDAKTFRTQLQAATDKAIAKAVQDGVITQAQADALKAAKDRFGGRHGFGGGMRGGRGGLRNGAPGDAGTTGDGNADALFVPRGSDV